MGASVMRPVEAADWRMLREVEAQVQRSRELRYRIRKKMVTRRLSWSLLGVVLSAVLATVVLSGCATLAPRIGECPSPQSLEIGGWQPTTCSAALGNLRDVWCTFEGWSYERHTYCRAHAYTIGCGEWTYWLECDDERPEGEVRT